MTELAAPQDWWLIAVTPDGTHVWNLGPHAQPGDPGYDPDGDHPLRSSIDAALGEVDAPADAATVDGWDVSVVYGEPHPSLLARATVHTL